MAFNYEEIIMEKDESIGRLEEMLRSTIISWYEDTKSNYKGIDDRTFVEKVCTLTGLSEAEYEDLLNGNTEECGWNL